LGFSGLSLADRLLESGTVHAIESTVKNESQAEPTGTPPVSDGASERRGVDRRRSAEDRRFWRALLTERRVSERRQARAPIPTDPTSTSPIPTDPDPTSPTPTHPDSTPSVPPIGPATAPLTDSQTDSQPAAPSRRVVSRRAKAVPTINTNEQRQAAIDSAPAERMDLNSTRTSAAGPGESAHRERLKTMLDAANLRQAKSLERRRRRPVMAAGVKVQIIAGPHARLRGTIIDADHINAKALVDVPGELLPVWVEFGDLAAGGPAGAH